MQQYVLSSSLTLTNCSPKVFFRRNAIIENFNLVLGTQLKSIYRFGEMAHCSAKWNEFKFCMSIKGLHPEQRRDAWIRHRAEWWARRRLGLSSENVWEMRKYVGSCFSFWVFLTECCILTSREPLRDYPPHLPPQDAMNALVD